MQVVSDDYGRQVRGRTSGFVAVRGTSLILGQLLTPDTKNFAVATSINEVDALGETTNTGILSATKAHQASLFLSLDVLFPDGSTYSGMIGAIIPDGEGFIIVPSIAAGAGSVSVALP